MKKFLPKKVVLLVGVILVSAALQGQSPRASTSAAKLSPVTVLMYHEVTAKKKGEQFAIPVELFQKQMEFLAQEGYQTITTLEYVRYLTGKGQLPPKPVMITFDDWTPGQFTLARPILSRLHLRAVFFVPTAKIRTPEEQKKIKLLASEGHEIGSHTIHHYYLTQSDCQARWKCCQQGKPCTEAEMRTEIVGSYQELAQLLGKPPLAIAWPGNYFNDQTIALALSAGYIATYAVENQVMENGILTNRVGVTTGPEKIYRTEIGGTCDMKFFPQALASQRCCLYSTRPFHRHCLMMEP